MTSNDPQQQQCKCAQAEVVASSKTTEFRSAVVVDIPLAKIPFEVTSKASAAVVLNVGSHLGDIYENNSRLCQKATPSPPQSMICGNYASTVKSCRYDSQTEVQVPKKFKADSQIYCPPPMFIILISLLEIGVFVYDYLTVEPQRELNSTKIPSQSVFIYRPDRRVQIWRFISYMVLHANWFHLGFNVVIQLLYGLPLELVHGSLRVAVIYFAGVFAGSLGTSVVDSGVYLVGASGGVYALLAAQLANILLNHEQMRYGTSQLVSVVIFVLCDLGYALYSKYMAVDVKTMPSVSYIAHLTGSLAGFTMGLLILKNFVEDSKLHSKLIWWLALGVYLAFMIYAVVFNLINTVTAQMLEEQGEVIRQHLLHDLGIS